MKDIRCLLGKHTGQAQGGTMMFTCPRCRRSFWQPYKYRSQMVGVEKVADALIDAGRIDEARQYARREVEKAAGNRRAAR